MITHCSECDTYFRVSVEQLKAANGQVKCGCCMTVFNAIESLLENQEIPASSFYPVANEKAEIDIAGATGSALLGAEDVEDTPLQRDVHQSPDSIEEELESTSWEDIHFTREDETTSAIDAEFSALDIINAEPDDRKSQTSERSGREQIDAGIYPDPNEQYYSEQHPYSQKLWSYTAVLMIALFGFQIAQYNPGVLLGLAPQLKPLCKIIDCPIDKPVSNASKIQLVSRDVREHPQFSDVLLVNATLVNSDDQQTAFPALQLDLFDNIGRPIGSRRFEPAEYLDSSVDLVRGMQPEQPVHVVLEIVGTGKEASSFEFHFL